MVPLDVSLQQHLVVESLLAQMAGKRPLLRVDAGMRLQGKRALVSFVAHLTDVLPLIRVHPSVVVANIPMLDRIRSMLDSCFKTEKKSYKHTNS